MIIADTAASISDRRACVPGDGRSAAVAAFVVVAFSGPEVLVGTTSTRFSCSMTTMLRRVFIAVGGVVIESAVGSVDVTGEASAVAGAATNGTADAGSAKMDSSCGVVAPDPDIASNPEADGSRLSAGATATATTGGASAAVAVAGGTC